MHVSPYNIALDINEPGHEREKLIYNQLTRSVDVCSVEAVKLLDQMKSRPIEVPKAFANYMAERGYIHESKEAEDKLIDETWRKASERIKTEPINFAIAPTYNCNLACTYCYQKDLDQAYENTVMCDEVLDKAQEFIMKKLLEYKGKRPPYVTLWGGEPLLTGARQRRLIERIVMNCKNAGIPMSVTTGGVNLYEYCELLSQVQIAEINVSMDGVEEVQDSRRVMQDGSGSFKKVMRGLEEAVRRGFPVSIRTVVDPVSIPKLGDFIDMFDEKGWFDLGQDRFRIELQHNGDRVVQELARKMENLPPLESAIHHKGEKTWRQNKLLKIVDNRPLRKAQDVLLSRMSHNDVYKMYWKERLEAHRAICDIGRSSAARRRAITPEFQGMRHINDHGEGPPAKFFCSSGVGSIGLDPSGSIYACVGSMGEPEANIGTFYQKEAGKDSTIQNNPERSEEWSHKNVMEIDKCKVCDVRFACGSGCARMAFPRVSASDPGCEPIEDIMQIGLDYYYSGIEKKWIRRAPESVIPAAG